MARGAWSKEQVWNKILATFPEAFVNEKEIRVPMIENGERVEIKVVLTCAKENVGGAETVAAQGTVSNGAVDVPVTPTVAEPSADEKKQVSDFLAKLGL